MKTDKELADELDAKKRLERHGLRQVDCPVCTIADRVRGVRCLTCEGKGYIWKPMELIHEERQRPDRKHRPIPPEALDTLFQQWRKF